MAAILVEHVSKRYRVGARERYGALRDSLARVIAAPLRAVRYLAGARQPPSPSEWMLALDDVSFEVQPGEVIGIVGRNGSGKSTLLKILSRITDPTSGRGEVRGRVGSLLEVGTGFHPELSGRENVFVNGAILGMKRAEIAARFDEIVAFAGVERFLDTPVKHYSSGMEARLAFAVAAHLEPDIMLVDEVLAVGDLEFQQKCLGKMDDVSRHGRTILFVSHQLNQLRRLCGRCLWLDRGRLRTIGATTDVMGQYEASFMQPTVTDDAGRSPGAAFLRWTLGTGAFGTYTLTEARDVTVRFELRVDRPITSGHHAVTLCNREGAILWGAGVDNLQLAPGVHELTFTIESLPVRPGPYRWHVELFENYYPLTSLDCAPELSVETAPLTHRRDDQAGVLNLPYRFRIGERQAAAAPVRSVPLEATPAAEDSRARRQPALTR